MDWCTGLASDGAPVIPSDKTLKHEIIPCPCRISIPLRRLRCARNSLSGQGRREEHDDRQPAGKGGKEGGKSHHDSEPASACDHRRKENYNDNHHHQVTI